MKITTIKEEAWQQLNSHINAIADYPIRQKDITYDYPGLNSNEICQYLHISEKTLWCMRTNGQIAFSKRYGQYYYSIGAIKETLNANAVQTTDEYVEQLMAKDRSCIEQGRKLKSGNK